MKGAGTYFTIQTTSMKDSMKRSVAAGNVQVRSPLRPPLIWVSTSSPVQIPVEACAACRQTGFAWFEEGTRGAFSHVYLQDRVRGIYECT